MLPNQLQEQLTATLHIIEEDPDHDLKPVFRKKVYQAIATITMDKAPLIRAWLAFLTAQHVRPIWEEAFPTNKLVDEVLHLVVEALEGRLEETALHNIWRKIQQEEDLSKRNTVDDRQRRAAWYVCFAAEAALREAQRIDPFEELADDPDAYFVNLLDLGLMELSELASKSPLVELTNDWLDPGQSDTAKWAAAAYANPIGTPDSDPSRRKVFWYWWLQTAIPTAWERASC